MEMILKRIANGDADFYIGGKENPYLKRWYLYRSLEEGSVYLHQMLRDDDDRALHDHPWDFFSFLLAGGYREHTSTGIVERRVPVLGGRPDIVFRQAKHAHRLELFRDLKGNIIPAWTIVFTGPKIREWGFHCPQGWVHWSDFVDATDTGNVGKGCAQ
jgi:hypothetical protein